MCLGERYLCATAGALVGDRLWFIDAPLAAGQVCVLLRAGGWDRASVTREAPFSCTKLYEAVSGDG